MNIKKLISLVLVCAICFSTFTSLTIESFAWDAESYWSRAHNFNLDGYEKTGVASKDILNVATRQRDCKKSYFGYPGAWCAAFVSDCAKLAGQSKAIPFDPTCGPLREKVLNAGGYHVVTPQSGDLVFYYSVSGQRYCHVGIMKGSSLSVQGNVSGKVWDDLKYSSYSNGGAYTVEFIRPNYDNSKEYQVETPCDLYKKTVKGNVIVRSGPAEVYPEQYRIPNKGTKMHVKAYYLNEHGNIWYKLDNDLWIYSKRLEDLSTYKITYHSKGGSNIPATQTKIQDEAITLSTVYPTKKGCQFLGWSTNKNVKSIYTDDEDAVAQVKYQPGDQYTANKKLNLYAVWLETKTTVSLSKTKVDLCLNDDNTEKITVTINGQVNSDYSIELSNVNNATSKASALDVKLKINLGFFAKLVSKKATATVTLTAKEKGISIIYVNIKDNKGKIVAKSGISLVVTEKYSVTYNANGGSGAPKSQTKTSGKNLQLSANVPTKSGYSFMGWAMPDSNGKAVYGPGDLYRNDSAINLTAVWGADYFIDPIISADGKTLTIRGNGDMPNYGANTYTSSKWNKYASTVETIQFEAINGGKITSIGSYAFANFKKLSSIVIPNTVSRIYSYAFYGCTSLRTVTAPADAILGSYAFANCDKLNSYSKTSKTTKSVYSASSIDEATGSIGAFAFENCVNLQSIDVSNVDAIGEGAFSGCTSLSDIKLSSSLKCIEDSTFYNCTDLTTINIPDSVTEISEGAFSGCSALEEIVLSDQVTSIGNQAFSGCSAISEVDVPDSVKFIGSSVFANCTSLEQVDLPDNINALGDSMFAGCTSLEQIIIPEGTVEIGSGTFFGCSSLSKVNLSESVNAIGDNAFAYCTSLESITMPETVTSINSFAFYGCESLRDVEYPSGLKEIGSCAFGECVSLQEIVLPESIELVDEGAFMNCTSLSKLEIPESMISINDEAFAGCTSLKNVTIPESAEYVSDKAFANCSSSATISCYSTSPIYNDLIDSSVGYNTIYPVQGFELKQSNITLEAGQSQSLVGVFSPVNATNKSVIWESQNEDVVTVSDTGLITGIDSGVATIVAMTADGNFISSCEVECVVPVEDIIVDDVSTTYYTGMEFMISYHFAPSNPTNIDVKFSSSNNNVATVNSEGIVSVIGKGDAVIAVSTPDGKISKSFTVTGEEYIPVERMDLNINTLNLSVNETAQLKATVYPQNASAKELVGYTSENELVATVDEFGLVKAVGVGETSIVCYIDDIEVVCTVIVTPQILKVNSVEINDIDLNYLSSKRIEPIINADSGANYTITYSSSNASVATIDESGNIYAIGKGSTTITVTVTDSLGNKVTDTCNVNVKYTVWQWIIIIILFGWIWY